jgi:N-acetylglutamate synthase-like GNAT family acetyltransferase
LVTYPNRKAGISERDVIEKFAKRARLEQRRSQLRSLSENERFFVAKEGNRVVGVCSAKKDADKNELQSIYVLPEYQGKGIGKLLWQKAMEFFDKSLPVVL